MIKLRTVALVAGAVLFGGSLIACGGNPSPSPTPAPTHSASPSLTEASPTTPVGPKSPPPVGAEQRNATRAAMEHLSGQNFSRTGLIKQLKYEGYSAKSSTAAVDSLHMDWSEQAALVARDYLQSQAFSKKSLKEQLEFDGFTSSQAAYGVAHSGL